ncbi:hypothetical protein [Streptomyces xiamenensis]|uniref:hypothetical protein n=1 Tax=Streptomyces xiamenensis TaxID=408015 RepID=UPI0037D0965C
MADIIWELPFCAESSDCFRLGTDSQGKAYIAVAGQEHLSISDSREALATMIREIKAGKADHLL